MSEAITKFRAGHAKPDYKETLDLREVLNLFRNNLGKIIVCIALGVGGALFYLHHTKPIYASSALLEVTQTGSQGSAPTEIETSEMLKTVELKLASQSILLAVIRANNLTDDPEFAAANPESGQFDPKSLRWISDGVSRLIARVTKSDKIASSSTASVDNGSGANPNSNSNATEPRAVAEPRADPTASPAGTPPVDAVAASAPAPEPLTDAELVRRFSSKVGVHVMRGSRLISLRVEDRSPERAQRLSRSIIDEFFKQSRDARSKDATNNQELLVAQVKRLEDAFRSSQEKLEAYRAKYNAVSLAERQNIVVERLRELNQQVTGAKNTRLAREAEVNQVDRLSNSPPESLLGIRAIAESQDIIDMRKQVTTKEAEVATMAQRYGPKHPTMLQQQSELEELRSAFRGALRRATARIHQTYESSKAVEHSLENALAEQEKAALELDRIAIPYNGLEREVQANGEMYRKMLDELNKTTVQRGMTSNNDVNGIDIRIVEPPLVPTQPARPRRDLLLAISVATGLFFGCGLALGARALDTSITSDDGAEATLGLPVLATVPRTRHHRLSSRPMVLRYPASAQAEAFRSLRTALSLTGEEEARCVMFTSALPGEGKSFCSLNCASAYAQQGMRTLLIDADLRRPSLMQIFSDPDDRPTLTACMRDPSRFLDAVRRTPIENLFRLGNWRNEAGSAELMARSGLREIIERATASFDRVVIDSAPLMAVSDTLYLAQNVSTVCLVIYTGKTPRRMAKRALKMLEEVSKRTATGLVLNKIKNRTSAEQYYYYNA